jgi:molybdopterin biosynthesis enzyme
MSDSTPASPGDVRMRGFARRTTVDDALAWLDRQLSPLAPDRVSLAEAWGRALAEDVTSAVNVPAFDRSMMDGYAVRIFFARQCSTNTLLWR